MLLWQLFVTIFIFIITPVCRDTGLNDYILHEDCLMTLEGFQQKKERVARDVLAHKKSAKVQYANTVHNNNHTATTEIFYSTFVHSLQKSRNNCNVIRV